MKKQANERTFQGILFNTISEIIQENPDFNFLKITQEENIGVGKVQRFADGLLYSSNNIKNIVLFELKNTKWEATEDELVDAAANKAVNAGFDFFVTGTPRQLAIYKTFETGKSIQERRIEIFNLSSIRKDDEVKTQNFKTLITNRLKLFLKRLSNLTHGISEIIFDNINNLYINRLSSYILDASIDMWDLMVVKINADANFKTQIKLYLEKEDIFNLNKDLDDDNIYKLCQLANYMLYLKILFYSNLQRNVPQLQLRPLLIPDDSKLLNSSLQTRFAEVLEHDYEMIFSPSIIDEFEFTPAYIPELRRNVDGIKNLNFNDLNADIIGSIYNTLLDNQEQHDRGQHFTNTDEVDIINAFCITPHTKFVSDTSCGAGTFLVRAYQFLKFYNPQLTHEQLLERVWGIEIATFPAFLAVMNLCLLNIKTAENYPLIIRSDFSQIKSDYSYSGYFLNANKEFEVEKIDNRKKKVSLPIFDVCVGNPPYIRQELIENKVIWNNLIKIEHGITKINQQSDFYVYYLMHTTSFLRNGGRLGYVISSSWLDVSFGRDLQEFLLKNFKIIAILDNQVKRSFETASINSVILVVEKCENKTERDTNLVRFVRIFKEYNEIIGGTWTSERLEKVHTFVKEIEQSTKSIENASYNLFVIKQIDLENESILNDKYTNGHWGAKYLRSPKIYNKIIRKSFKKFEKLSNIANITRGFTTGANDFFYVKDNYQSLENLTEQEYLVKMGVSKQSHKEYWKRMGYFFSEMDKRSYEIERFYVKPLFKTQREALNLDVDVSNLHNFVVLCSDSKKKLEKYKNKVLNYIKSAESLDIQNRPTMSVRDQWYDLSSSAVVGDFIFPSKIGEKFRLIDNRKAKVHCDKVNYAITINENYEQEKNLIFLILNSTIFRFFIDLFSRQLTGAQTLSDVDVIVVKNTIIPKPELLIPYKVELEEIYQSFKSREQGTIFDEVMQKDRRRLDEIIFEALGLDKSDVNDLYKATCNYVAMRKQKSESVVSTKKKQKYSFDDALLFIKERFPEIKTYKKTIKNKTTQEFKIPSWKAKFPKNSDGNGNIFNNYPVYFVEGNLQKTVNFSNAGQLQLFQYLYNQFDIKNIDLKFPTSEAECLTVFKSVQKDFNKYSEQIKNLLKSHRISIHYLSIYKTILFGD